MRTTPALDKCNDRLDGQVDLQLISSLIESIDYNSLELFRLAVSGQYPTILEAINNNYAALVEALSNGKAILGAYLLHLGICTHSVEFVKRAIDLGVSVEATNKEGMSALHIAVQSGDILMARTLLAKGADGNIRDNRGYNALGLALLCHSTNSIAMALELIQHGTDLKAFEKKGELKGRYSQLGAMLNAQAKSIKLGCNKERGNAFFYSTKMYTMEDMEKMKKTSRACEGHPCSTNKASLAI